MISIKKKLTVDGVVKPILLMKMMNILNYIQKDECIISCKKDKKSETKKKKKK